MEFTLDLTNIQSIIKGLERSPGELLKINYKSGNETKIQNVVDELRNFLLSKNYLASNKDVNESYKKEITDIVMFLVINTKFNNTTLNEIKEYEHLINIMPTISKCLLMNIIIELDLSECYGHALQILPLHLTEELLSEVVTCLSTSSPYKIMKHAKIFLKEIVMKLSSTDLSTRQNREDVQKLNDIAGELLMRLSGLNCDTIQEWGRQKIYQHIGHACLNLLQLMRLCNPENETLSKMIDLLIYTTSTVAKSVTIEVFCVWADVQHEGKMLQTTVGEEAYHVIEKYTKYKRANELIQILSTIARKPQTLTEIMQFASIETVIERINESGPNQLKWFNELFKTKIFDSPASMDCLSKWSHLCTIENVDVLLKQSRDSNSLQAKKLVLQCAANLSYEDLTMLLSRYFFNYGLNNHLEYKNIQQELTLFLNKINQSKERTLSLHELENSFIQEIELLMLQNPKEVIKIMYSECIKNTVYTFWLKHAFLAFKIILEIESIGLKMFETILKEIKITDENLMPIVHLIKMLCETQCCDTASIFSILFNEVEEKHNLAEMESLKYLLVILKELDTMDSKTSSNTNHCLLLFNIMERYRCKYTNFSNLSMEIVNNSIILVKKFKISPLGMKNQIELSAVNKYYTKPLTASFLNTVAPVFNTENYGDCISKLLLVLSRCISSEWSLLTYELDLRFGAEKTLEMLTDTVLLISQVTKSSSNEENVIIFNALQYYLQCYGICIKDLLNKENNVNFEVNVVKQVCRLLRDIPPAIKLTHGMNLIALFTQNALKLLTEDKNFVSSLVRIGDSQLAQVIAKKMLAK